MAGSGPPRKFIWPATILIQPTISLIHLLHAFLIKLLVWLQKSLDSLLNLVRKQHQNLAKTFSFWSSSVVWLKIVSTSSLGLTLFQNLCLLIGTMLGLVMACIDKMLPTPALIVIVITFYSPSCLGQEIAKGPFGLQVKLPPTHLSTTGGGGFTLSL